MNFADFLFEEVAKSAVHHVGIRLQHDPDTGEHSTTVPHGHKSVAKLHSHLKKEGWKHSEHNSGHVYTHPVTKNTVTIYHKGAGDNGHNHHEIVLGKG